MVVGRLVTGLFPPPLGRIRARGAIFLKLWWFIDKEGGGRVLLESCFLLEEILFNYMISGEGKQSIF